jgi:beta-glucanase (GH16 family)
MRWYVDDKLTFERDRATAPWLDTALAGTFFLRLNMAVGGRFPGAPDAATRLPADMVVDWVRVYQ